MAAAPLTPPGVPFGESSMASDEQPQEAALHNKIKATSRRSFKQASVAPRDPTANRSRAHLRARVVALAVDSREKGADHGR